MVESSPRGPQTSSIEDSVYDKARSADPRHRVDQDNDLFLYANSCLGFFPAEPVDFRAFAKGQLITLAIAVAAALAIFMFSG